MYNSLKNWKEGIKPSKIKILSVYLYNLLIRLILGIPKNVLKNSFNWSLKFANYNKNLGFNNYLFTIINDNFKEFVIIENMRIYSTKKSQFNFNPITKKII